MKTKSNETNSFSGESLGVGLDAVSVETVPVSSLRSHPSNTYEMNDAEITTLAENIAQMGLLEWPLVRVVDDGGLQILSGHRRVAAVRKLAKHDSSWENIPVRVARGINDQDALLILHSGNIYRNISREARKRQIDELQDEIVALRHEHPEWKGHRTDEIIAGLLGMETRTFKREKKVLRSLIPELYSLYSSGVLGKVLAYQLAFQDDAYQLEVAKYIASKHPTSVKEGNAYAAEFMKGIRDYLDEADVALSAAEAALFLAIDLMRHNKTPTRVETERMEEIRKKIDRLLVEARTLKHSDKT